MTRKTIKRSSRRNRRRTLRRKRRGGADSQALIPPTSAFKNATPVNSDSAWYKIG